MNHKKLLTRKDIAQLLGISARAVKSNERRLGLDKFRVSVNSRAVFFQGWRVIPMLAKRGLIAE